MLSVWVDQAFWSIFGKRTKISAPAERYILLRLATAIILVLIRWLVIRQGAMTSHMISYTNRRHISAAKVKLQFGILSILTTVFVYCRLAGVTGKRLLLTAAKFDIQEIIYSRVSHPYGGYGGIAYHHVLTNIFALFYHFITCGCVGGCLYFGWAVEKTLHIQPDTLHADTQGSWTCVCYFLSSWYQIDYRVSVTGRFNFCSPSADVTL